MKFRIIVSACLLLVLQVYKASAQQLNIAYSQVSKPVKQYEKAEWDIKLSVPFTNPYDQQEVALDMVMISPSGKPVVLPCYFENGNGISSNWKARFAPQQAGHYNYYFTLSGKAGSALSATAGFDAIATEKPGFLHKNNYWTFKFDNGNLFRGVGENIGWESRSFENDKWTYDHLLPALAKNGGNFFRTWMCYWNLPLEWQKVRSTKRYQNTDQYYNPGAIKRMDELVNMTDSLHLYFMLTMDWHGHLMENGGWKNSPYNVVNGGPAKTPTDFFTSQEARSRYKNKLRYIVARWGYSTSIAAFEFFNEIDNAAFNSADSVLIPHHVITEWHDEMSRYLKDIDPYGHMVTTSVSHRDIIGMNSIAYIDFNQKHIYKHTEKIPGIYTDYIQTFGKPYVVGEFGYRWEDADPKYAKEADYDYKRGLWYGLFSECPILPMSWWWEFFDEQNMTPYINSVRMISDQMLKAGNGSFQPVEVKAGLAEAYGVKCGNTRFVYLLNNTEGKISTTVSLPPESKVIELSSFTPTDRQYKKLSSFSSGPNGLKINNIQLEAKQELVLIIK